MTITCWPLAVVSALASGAGASVISYVAHALSYGASLGGSRQDE
jgi:hypothetical protein